MVRDSWRRIGYEANLLIIRVHRGNHGCEEDHGYADRERE